MRYFVTLAIFTAASAQAQTFSPQGFRNAVNAEQNSKKNNLPQANEVYGIKIGSKASDLTLLNESPDTYKSGFQGVVRKIVVWDKSNLKPPSPLSRGIKAWGFVMVDESNDTIVGAGIAEAAANAPLGMEMRNAVKAKCENATDYPVHMRQGGEAYMRPRLGEVEGETGTGLVMIFTDRGGPGTTGDIMRLSYIDLALVSKAVKKSVDSSGF